MSKGAIKAVVGVGEVDHRFLERGQEYDEASYNRNINKHEHTELETKNNQIFVLDLFWGLV